MAATWFNAGRYRKNVPINSVSDDRHIAIPRKILKEVGALYVVISQNASLVVITSEKIKYHLNTVGHDILRISKSSIFINLKN